MAEFGAALAAALWLGLLTSVSPCPLAANVAAVSYVARGAAHPGRVLLTGAAYTLGRAVTYAALAALVTFSLLNLPVVSHFLQTTMVRVLGPLLILAGMVVLGLLPLPFRGPDPGRRLAARASRGGILGGGMLGMALALSFCPVSAALFFGSLLPLALHHRSPVVLPSVYGIGTALPVVGFAVALALGARSLAGGFDRLTRLDLWARRLTGAVFIGVGLYLVATEVFRLG